MFWDNVSGIYDFYQLMNFKANNGAASICASYISKDDIVLECACGTGIMTKIIAPHCRKLVATDYSRKMLRRAKHKLGRCRNIQFLAADTVNCTEVDQSIRRYHPEVIILNCCEATIPLGRLIMNLSDVEKVCEAAPQAVVVASHLDSVNHALLTRNDIITFANERNLSGIRVPEDGERIIL